MAANDGNLSEVKRLIQAGVDVNYFDLSGDWSDLDAVEIAACHGHVEIVRELLKAGAKNRIFFDSGIKYQHPDIIRVWLQTEEAQKDINLPYDSIGATALINAAFSSVEIVEILVEAGADVNVIAWGTDESALDIAIRENNTEVVEYLWPHCSQEIRARAGLVDDPRKK